MEPRLVLADVLSQAPDGLLLVATTDKSSVSARNRSLLELLVPNGPREQYT